MERHGKVPPLGGGGTFHAPPMGEQKLNQNPRRNQHPRQRGAAFHGVSWGAHGVSWGAHGGSWGAHGGHRRQSSCNLHAKSTCTSMCASMHPHVVPMQSPCTSMCASMHPHASPCSPHAPPCAPPCTSMCASMHPHASPCSPHASHASHAILVKLLLAVGSQGTGHRAQRGGLPPRDPTAREKVTWRRVPNWPIGSSSGALLPLPT